MKQEIVMRKLIIALVLTFVLSFGVAQAQESITLTLAAYTTPREAYAEIIPLFQAYWLEQSGQQVTFQESYLGSGAQSRAVAEGFEADIVALSLERDVTRLVEAGLVTHDWQGNDYNGMVTTSLVTFVVRPGNPDGIADWADLAREGIEVLTPDPATSGGAQWNIMAAYGAALRGNVEGYESTSEGAYQFLVDLLNNVSVLDPGARESVITFSQGVGDVLITYENEYYAGIAAGDQYEIVYPSSTILIENPVAVVDAYADAHGVREAADAFVQFLYTPEAQAIFAAKGYRPPIAGLDTSPDAAATEEVPASTEEAIATEEGVATEEAAVTSLWPEGALDETLFPPVADVFTVLEFGGWPQIATDFFSEGTIFAQAIAQAQQE
jgi:sulfate/thiosulfate transport system substrate-binding protein